MGTGPTPAIFSSLLEDNWGDGVPSTKNTPTKNAESTFQLQSPNDLQNTIPATVSYIFFISSFGI